MAPLPAASTSGLVARPALRPLCTPARRPAGRGSAPAPARRVAVAVMKPPEKGDLDALEKLEAGERVRLESGDAFEELKALAESKKQSVNRPQVRPDYPLGAPATCWWSSPPWPRPAPTHFDFSICDHLVLAHS